MPDSRTPATAAVVVMDATAVQAKVHRLAAEIAEQNADISAFVLLGILRRGRPLADRLALQLHNLTGVHLPVGSLATTLYRDDFRVGARPAARGDTHFDFSIDGRTILLVDDVLAAGRTIRAAMDELKDYGRPARIQLACLIDRGRRELPIQADYLGASLSTQPDEWVSVHLQELDGEDAVIVERRV